MMPYVGNIHLVLNFGWQPFTIHIKTTHSINFNQQIHNRDKVNLILFNKYMNDCGLKFDVENSFLLNFVS